MAITRHVELINSGIKDKAPLATDLVNGEIAINYNAESATLYIKDTAGKIREFKTKEVAENLFNSLKGGTLSTTVGYRNVAEIASTLETFLTATTDTDATINKWKELEAFLNGIPDSNSTLVGLMANKVDKTTTVNGHALSGNITITKANVGLGSVDNTSDAAKPVSTAQATAIAAAKKAGTDAQTNLTSHIGTKTNPHGVTKTQVGLGNVDNTADSAKPVSTAQQTALNLKLDKSGGTITNNLTVGKELQANLIKSTTDIIAYAGSDATASGMILDDISDVDTSGKQNGYSLVYNGTSSKWEAKEVKAGGGLVEVSFSDIKGSPTDNTALNTSLGTKVDKVSGKGLSTNDYDATEKSKVTSAVQAATIGGTAVTKSGTTLQLPAYPTTLPASDVPSWAKASSLAVASVPNLPSNKITAMTGYSKATAVAAIAATDSLNVAVGKLEKALDGKQASGSYEPAFSKNNAFNKSFGTAANTVCQGNDSRLSDSRNAKDVYAWAKASTKPSYAFSEITGDIRCGTY